MAALRPWNLPVDLDLFILQHLTAEEASVFRLVSKSCRDIINRFDELLFKPDYSLDKPELLRSHSWRQISLWNERKKYPSKNSKSVLRSVHYSSFEAEQIGKMILRSNLKKKQLINWQGFVFRELDSDISVLDCSYLSALVFSLKTYSNRILYKDSEIDLPRIGGRIGILYNEGKHVALSTGCEVWHGPIKNFPRYKTKVELNSKLSQMKNRLLIVEKKSISIIRHSIENNEDKASFSKLQYEEEIREFKVNSECVTVTTDLYLYIESLNGERIKRIIRPYQSRVFVFRDILLQISNCRFIVVSANKTYSTPEVKVAFNTRNWVILAEALNRFNIAMMLVIIDGGGFQRIRPHIYHIASNQFTLLSNEVGLFYWIDNHLLRFTYEGVYKIMDSSEDSTTVH